MYLRCDLVFLNDKFLKSLASLTERDANKKSFEFISSLSIK